jgi:hypothetical protein
MMENETLEEYRKRVKDTIEANEVKPIIAKGGVITPLS